MRKRRKLLIAGIALAIVAIAALVLYQRTMRVSQRVYLLPEADLLLYVNLKPLHFFNLKNASVQSEPEYQEFITQTGFQWERDLDEIAISQRNPNSADSESSALFTGHADVARLTGYLQKLATATEHYAGKVIYSVPHEGRTVRVCILDSGTVAVTNMASPEKMHGIIDKVRNPSLAGRGPYLLENYYDRVPAASPVWAIYRPTSQQGAAQLPGGLGFDFLENTVTVASLRYSGSVHFRAEIITDSEAAAKRLVENATSFLALYRSVGQSVGARGTDRDVKAVIDSIQVRQNGSNAEITAVISEEFIRKVMSEGGGISVEK